mgnify:CR=1 FL=1
MYSYTTVFNLNQWQGLTPANMPHWHSFSLLYKMSKQNKNRNQQGQQNQQQNQSQQNQKNDQQNGWYFSWADGCACRLYLFLSIRWRFRNGCSPDGWEVRRTCGGGHKGGHQGFHPCESCFLYFLVWRRSESGDRFEIGERQRIFTSVSFSTCSQCQIPFCYTGRLLPAGAT